MRECVLLALTIKISANFNSDDSVSGIMPYLQILIHICYEYDSSFNIESFD